MRTVLMVVGSLRRKSFNGQLARHIAEVLDGRARTEFLDFADLPLMNQDIEFPAPAPVARVREKVVAADGLWFVTPEYNHGIPGPLKNLLDWLSRPTEPGGTSVLAGRTATFCGAAGASSSACVQDQMLFLLNFVRMHVPAVPRTLVQLTPDEFATDELRLSERSREAVRAQADAFLQALEKAAGRAG